MVGLTLDFVAEPEDNLIRLVRLQRELDQVRERLRELENNAETNTNQLKEGKAIPVRDTNEVDELKKFLGEVQDWTGKIVIEGNRETKRRLRELVEDAIRDQPTITIELAED